MVTRDLNVIFIILQVQYMRTSPQYASNMNCMGTVNELGKFLQLTLTRIKKIQIEVLRTLK